MDFDFHSETDWTQAKNCNECNVPPQIKCNLEWIQLTCPICGRFSMTHITHGIKVAIDDWNNYHTEDLYKRNARFIGEMEEYMRYKISDVYIRINGETIAVGIVLGEEDKPRSPFRTEYITNSEYEKGLKSFKYGKQQIGDLVYHQVAEFKDFVATRPVEQKWIDELELMGYDVSKLKYEIQS